MAAHASTRHSIHASCARGHRPAHACGWARRRARGASLPVESIDVYGSAVLNSAAIRSEFEADILRYVATMDRIRLPNADFDEIGKTLLGIRDKLRASLEQRVPLAYLEIAVLTNSAPPAGPLSTSPPTLSRKPTRRAACRFTPRRHASSQTPADCSRRGTS